MEKYGDSRPQVLQSGPEDRWPLILDMVVSLIQLLDAAKYNKQYKMMGTEFNGGKDDGDEDNGNKDDSDMDDGDEDDGDEDGRRSWRRWTVAMDVTATATARSDIKFKIYDFYRI